MTLDGIIDLDVPVDRAWDFLIDINKFSTCLLAIESVTVIDATLATVGRTGRVG